jgi:hypothetical protein
LIENIALYLVKYKIVPHTKWVSFLKIRYDKGLFSSIEPPPASYERLCLSFSQKYPDDFQEYEYRFVVELPFTANPRPAYIAIDLGKKVEDADILGIPDT